MSLLAELNDCRNAGESLAACIVRLYRDATSPMCAAATAYVASIKPEYRESNPKIDIFRQRVERDFRYVSSTNWHRTCRDALIHKMLAEPNVAFKAYRGK